MHRRLIPALGALLLSPMLVPVLAAAPVSAAPATEPPAVELAEPLAVEPGEPAQPADDVGRWSITATGPDTWTVAWRAPDRLPITSDRPTIVAAEGLPGLPTGAPLGVPTVAEDGRTVEVAVVSAEPPSPESLDVVLSGEVLDEGTVAPSDAGPQRQWEEPVRELLDVDPGERGDLPVTTSDYDRRGGLEIAGMRSPVEVVGHVVKPAPEAEDPSHPLVVFLHGRHNPCYNPENGRMAWRWPCPGAQVPVPSHLGYDYVQQLLASQGYVTVSIAANGINAQDDAHPDGGASARSQLVQAHLDQWVRWSGQRYEVDLDKVVLVGHSRGGEGVSRAALEIPLSAPYTVAGQVLIGPTNFGRQTTPYVPTVTVLPSCDGDVIDLQGQIYTDVARGLADGDTSMKSSVMAVGANHNYFNTEWTPRLAAAPAIDDWGGKGGVCGRGTETRLTAAEQRRVGKAYVAGAVHLFADGDQAYRPMYDGSAVRVRSTGDAVVLSHMVGGDRTTRVPGPDATLTPAVGAETALCEGLTPWGRTRKPLCGRYARTVSSTPHWPAAGSLVPTDTAFEMSWEATGGRGGLRLATPLDLTGSDWLDLRTVVDPKVGDVTVRVRITDGDGASVSVDPVGGTALPALPHGDRWVPGKYWAQTLRVDTAELTGIDTSAVSEVELVGTSDHGRVWVLDLAAAEATLPPVPARRVPIVDLGAVKVDEGGDGTEVAAVPFTITGDVNELAEFAVYGYSDDEGGRVVRVDVDVPVGSVEGTVDWEYAGDTLDSYPRVFHELFAHPVRNVMVRDNAGRVVVVDDDPSPELSFRALRPRTQEGDSVELELTLSAPSGFEIGAGLQLLPGEEATEPLRAHDVPERWLKRWTTWRDGTDPALHELEVVRTRWVAPGETTAVFRIPLRDDARTESREALTLRATTGSGWRSEPVTVRVPAND